MRFATPKEARLIARIERLNLKISKAAKTREKAFEDLADLTLGECTAVFVDGYWTVYEVGQPRGKYVFFNHLAFVKRRRATRAEELKLKKGANGG